MRSSQARALLASGGLLLLGCGSPERAQPEVSTPAGVASPGGAAADALPEAPPNAAGSGAADEPAPAAAIEGEGGAGLGVDAPIASPDGAEPGAGGSGAPETPDPIDPAQLPPISIWIAGDSTVANGNTPCPRGWGGVFAPHFDERVSVINSAAGGRSVHTWLYEVQAVMDATGECALTRDERGEPLLQPRWQAMLDGMGDGDYLFIQFGINDGDRSCDRHVGIEAFITAYGMMAQAAKERGAQPVFLTPVSSVACNGATARGSRGEFVPATLEAGETFDVPVIDLHARSVALYQSRGFCPVPGGDVSAATTGPVGDFFCDDHTHFSSAGAVDIAELVAQALVEQNLPLARYLR